jgi:hypothetical protein
MLGELVMFRSILKRFKISSYYLKNYFPAKRIDGNAHKLHHSVLKIGELVLVNYASKKYVTRNAIMMTLTLMKT